ncbi:MAG: hypothetical protein QRY74_04560 [Chlamydia sp.]
MIPHLLLLFFSLFCSHAYSEAILAEQKKSIISINEELLSKKKGISSLLFLRDNGLWDPIFTQMDCVIGATDQIELSYTPIALNQLKIPLLSAFDPLKYDFMADDPEDKGSFQEIGLLIPFPEKRLKISEENRESEKKIYEQYKALRSPSNRILFLQRFSQMAVVLLFATFAIAVALLYASYRLYISRSSVEFRKKRIRRVALEGERAKIRLLMQKDSSESWSELLEVIKEHFSEQIPKSATLEEMQGYSIKGFSLIDWQALCTLLHKRRYNPSSVSNGSSREFNSAVKLFYSYLKKL